MEIGGGMETNRSIDVPILMIGILLVIVPAYWVSSLFLEVPFAEVLRNAWGHSAGRDLVGPVTSIASVAFSVHAFKAAFKNRS